MRTVRDQHLEYDGVVAPIMKYLNSLPCAKVINVHGSVFSERGTPDVIGSVGGRAVAFECKRSAEEEPTRIQLWRLSEWIRAGAVVGAVSSVRDVDLTLRLMGVIGSDQAPGSGPSGPRTP